MNAVQLADGRVHRPYFTRRNLSPSVGGCGCDPSVRVVAWDNLSDYQGDVAAGNMDHGSFDWVGATGLALADSEDQHAICLALIATGGDYDGSTLL